MRGICYENTVQIKWQLIHLMFVLLEETNPLPPSPLLAVCFYSYRVDRTTCTTVAYVFFILPFCSHPLAQFYPVLSYPITYLAGQIIVCVVSYRMTDTMISLHIAGLVVFAATQLAVSKHVSNSTSCVYCKWASFVYLHISCICCSDPSGPLQLPVIQSPLDTASY